MHLPHSRVTVRICVGKEWYRFPSSFFLPSARYELSFIESGFKGLLPKPFELINGTSIIPTEMNDQNREEPSRYVPVSTCHFLIDLDLPHQSEPHYAADSQHWETLLAVPFLDAHHSPKQLYRALWVPTLSEHYNAYAPYVLLANKALRGAKH